MEKPTEIFQNLCKPLSAEGDKRIRKKVLRELDPHAVAVALDGMARTLFLQSTKDSKRYPYTERVAVVLDLFLKGGLAKRSRRLPYAS